MRNFSYLTAENFHKFFTKSNFPDFSFWNFIADFIFLFNRNFQRFYHVFPIPIKNEKSIPVIC